MQPAKTLEERDAQIAEIREKAAKRRAEAWAQVPESVLGIDLNPITPAIYSLLVGTRNAFVTGMPPVESDLRNFVWFCSKEFNPDKPDNQPFRRFLKMRKVDSALRGNSTKKNRAKVIIWNFYRACGEITDIVNTTFKDCMAPQDYGQPVAAALEAKIINAFAKEYRMWPLPMPVRHTPIKQIYQLLRCIDRSRYGNEDAYYDSDENEVTQKFLMQMNPKT